MLVGREVGVAVDLRRWRDSEHEVDTSMEGGWRTGKKLERKIKPSSRPKQPMLRVSAYCATFFVLFITGFRSDDRP